MGNADFKNPPGQAPDGSDHNKGYECDKNNGVGKTNPAHSGCKVKAETTTTTMPTVTTTTVIPATTVTTAPAQVLGTSIQAPVTTIAPATSLAKTGINAGKVATIGGVLILVGFLIVTV